MGFEEGQGSMTILNSLRGGLMESEEAEDDGKDKTVSLLSRCILMNIFEARYETFPILDIYEFETYNDIQTE